MRKYITLILKKPLPLIFFIALAILTLFFIYELRKTDCKPGVPLDDAFIHFQFSRNLAEGNGFSFNPDEPTPGSTSPAWTLLITVFYVFLHNHLLITKILSGIFYILTAIVTYFLGNVILKSKKMAVLSALFVLISGRFAWSALSAMEVTLFSFLLVLVLFMHYKKRSISLQALLLGIASTVRPEAYLLSIFFFLIESFKSAGKFRRCRNHMVFLNLIFSGFIYGIVILPYLLFSYHTSGEILPNTFRAQSLISGAFFSRLKIGILYILRYSYLILIDNPFLALFVPLGILNLLKDNLKRNKDLLLTTIAIGFPIVASITAPNLRHHGRYTIPFIPIYTIIGLYQLQKLRKKLKPSSFYLVTFISLSIGSIVVFTLSRDLFVPSLISGIIWIILESIFLAVILIIIPLLIGKHFSIFSYFEDKPFHLLFSISIPLLILPLLTWADTYAWNVKNINDMHVEIGKWVDLNIEEDALLAINDIGAISYLSERKIIDLVGLVSPDVLKVTEGLAKTERDSPLWIYINDKKADYLIILPCWYPEMQKEENLEEIYRIELDRYTMVDCEMVVYKIER